ncbi:MAG: FapA family protein [Acidobacteriota bacterium]|nr:FapA family protein [Acidobacteriota bacterium]
MSFLTENQINSNAPLLKNWQWLFALLVVLQSAFSAFGQHTPAILPDESNAIVVAENSDSDVFGFGKSVIVRGTVKKGVMAFGGDIIVEGRIEGDAATIGGSVYQRQNSHIGGDVVIIGGVYNHGKTAPGRNPESQTVMYAGFENELRGAMQNPASLWAPDFSAWYFVQRILAVLFWFVVSLVLTTISPGAVSRGITRLNLSGLKIAIVGALAMLVTTLFVGFLLGALPTPVSVLAGAMITVLLFLAYIFGRVVVNAATGKYIYKRIFGENRKRSESTALLLGTVFWVFVLSLPYFWAFAFIGLILISLGLVLTARRPFDWRNN